MTFQPYTRTRSWGALVVSRKESYCRRNILRKVNFRLMCSMFRINADTASSNMLSRSIRVIPSAFTKREVSHSPLVCCFCMFKGTYRGTQPSVSCLENTEMRQGVKKKMIGMMPFPSGLRVGGMLCKWLEGDHPVFLCSGFHADLCFNPGVVSWLYFIK